MRDDKQVELRIKELANMKMKYVELKNNTEPIINSLSTKVNILRCLYIAYCTSLYGPILHGTVRGKSYFKCEGFLY